MRLERFDRLRRVLDRRQPDLTVLMERVHKPHNLSAILRNCDAAGVLEVHAASPESGLSMHSATSGGTARWIPVHTHPDGPTAIRALRGLGYQIVVADPGSDAVDFREVDYTGPTALVVGAELFGISAESRRLADRTVQIPMAGMARSLNVSVAAALLLYEAYRQRDAAGLYGRSRLEPEVRERLLFEWAYPRLAARLRMTGRPYPVLDEEGAIRGDSASHTPGV